MAQFVPFVNQVNLASDDEFEAHQWVPDAPEMDWIEQSDDETSEEEVPLPQRIQVNRNTYNNEASEREDTPGEYINFVIPQRQDEETSQDENEIEDMDLLEDPRDIIIEQMLQQLGGEIRNAINQQQEDMDLLEDQQDIIIEHMLQQLGEEIRNAIDQQPEVENPVIEFRLQFNVPEDQRD